MKINRDEVVKDLKDFVLQGNGIIIGRPGIGKTHLAMEVSDALDAENILNVFLPIDHLGNGTEEEMKEILGYKEKFTDIFKEELARSNCKKGVLFFDSFDAARNEMTQRNFLRYIREAVEELDGQWNVIVTVRTYDAKKSKTLLALFKESSSEMKNYTDVEIKCRHFLIPPLSEKDIRESFRQVPGLEEVFKSARDEFKDLMRIPFYLWLLSIVVESWEDIRNIGELQSDVQLLSVFWRLKVANTFNRTEKEFILTECVSKMAQEYTLSVNSHTLHKEAIGMTNFSSVLDELLSDGILVRTSSNGGRLAFSHNILFDYAVSVLLLDEDVDKLKLFLHEDNSRVIFLRPSLMYYFSQLWYDTPHSFWRFFWTVLESEDTDFRLILRLIPCSVVVQEARFISQIINSDNPKFVTSPKRSYATAVIMQALRSLNIQRDDLWLDFIEWTSEPIDPDSVWDIAIVLSGILDRAIGARDTKKMDKCGQIGRRLLRWAWIYREGDMSKNWIDSLSASWFIPMVLSTYRYNIQESRTVLRKILDLTQEPDFPIQLLFRLTSNLDEIFESDIEFAEDIYTAVFTHFESSSDSTHLGGYVLALKSNRRQDYEMCQYNLVQAFSTLITTDPVLATRVAIKCVTPFILAAHVVPFRLQPLDVHSEVVTFEFQGMEASYLSDGSYIWDSNHPENPMELAKKLFGFLTSCSPEKSNLVQINSVLNIFAKQAVLAFFWKRLLHVGASRPEVYADYLFDLLLAKPLYLNLETRYEYCEFVGAVYPYLTDEQRTRIENMVMNFLAGLTGQKQEDALRLRNTILSKISPSLLRTNAAKEVRIQMQQNGTLVENIRPVRFESSVEPVTDEMWLTEQGVDPSAPQNRRILDVFMQPLVTFNSKYTNGRPDLDEVLYVLKHIKGAVSFLSNDHEDEIDEILSMRLWTELASCAEIATRITTNLTVDVVAFLRETLISCSQHKYPIYHQEESDNYRTASWSPFPRTGAAQALSRLVAGEDDPILIYVRALVFDSVPFVRMLAVRGLVELFHRAPEFYWQVTRELASKESNPVVRDSLIFTLSHTVTANVEGTAQILGEILTDLVNSGETSEVAFNLLGWLAFHKMNQWALRFYRELLSATISVSPKTLHMATFQALRYVTPKVTSSEAISWLNDVVDYVMGIISAARANQNDDLINDVYSVVNEIVVRLYFAADVNDKIRSSKEKALPELERQKFYYTIKPILQHLIEFAKSKESGIMFASTTHYFMELLCGVVRYEPSEVLRMARSVVEASEPYGYNLDSLAVRDVVNLVETLISDHKMEIRSASSVEDLLTLLDTFAKVGWGDALRLVWRLDEIFR